MSSASEAPTARAGTSAAAAGSPTAVLDAVPPPRRPGPPGPEPEPADPRPPYAAMPDHERSALWRQRLHEAEAGLTGFLVARGSEVDLASWFALQSQVFADLPEPETAGPLEWQRIFFRGQALMERFLVSRYGEPVLAEWARANAEVHRQVEPDRGGGAADPIRRIARQAELYGSRYELETAGGPAEAAVTITHCAIWDYRERARRTGVRLTLASPCTYCTEALSANIRAKGYQPAHRLHSGPTGHGCRWQATDAEAAPEPAAAEPAREA